MWKSGSGSQTRSSAVIRSRSAALVQTWIAESCVIRHPFGSAVVPEV